MKYEVKTTRRFDKDFKRCVKRGLDMAKLKAAMHLLAEEGELPSNYHPHKLSGNRDGQWECHLQPDWLMVWEQNDEELRLLFMQTGTHADLF